MWARAILTAAMPLIALAPVASAEPTLSLTWTHTTGTGTTGGNTIVAAPGDTLRLLVTAVAGPSGLSFASLSLDWDAGDLTGLDAAECPGPENVFAPVCTDGGTMPPPPAMVPFAEGVDIDNGAGRASSFDAGGVTPFDTSIVVGAIEFLVGNTQATETVDVSYVPGVDSVNDGQGAVYFPFESAYVVVPEPGNTELVRVGLGALGILAGRRRRTPSRFR
jgi:hypothetical protein